MFPGSFRTLSLSLIVLLLPVVAFAQSPGKSLLEERPCGPDSMPGRIRYLFPQGHGNTDFRPACRCHDNCYLDPNKTQEQCDLEFRQRMLDRCAANGNKCGCRFMARFMYMSVKLFGAGAYQDAQKKTAAKAAQATCCPPVVISSSPVIIHGQ